MRLSSPVPKKRARIEIIPLIDIMFFLLASFMMVSLSQTHMKGIRVNLPAAVGPPPSRVKDFVSIKVLEGNAVILRQSSCDRMIRYCLDLSSFTGQIQEIKISISADPMAMYGDVIGVLDKVRSVGITKVGYQIRAAGLGARPNRRQLLRLRLRRPALASPQSVGSLACKRANRFRAMTDGVFHFVGQFAESLLRIHPE